ncbi:MAG: phosphatidate cytidylyltransferase [Bacteroidota bacterium]
MFKRLTTSLDKLTELQQRILIGVPGAALVIGAIYWNDWTYFLLFGGICFLTQREFYKLLSYGGYRTFDILGLTTGMGLYAFAFLSQKTPDITEWWFLFILIPLFAYILQLYTPSRTPFPDLGLTFLGVLYVALPFGLLHLITITDDKEYHFERVLAFMFFLWSTDTGGYFAGRKFGRTKLFPRISPKKTWEGLAGGLLLSMGIGYGVSFFSDSLSPLMWVSMAATVSVMGIYGDLVESQLKRSLRVKNSGRGLPGHGGFMDRFDGMLLAVLGVLLLLEITEKF